MNGIIALRTQLHNLADQRGWSKPDIKHDLYAMVYKVEADDFTVSVSSWFSFYFDQDGITREMARVRREFVQFNEMMDIWLGEKAVVWA